VGASAGGVNALRVLVRGFPADYAGTILVVLHLAPWAHSELASILSRVGPLPAIQAGPQEPLEKGRVYVAPPDFHLIVEDGHVLRWRGPAEDRHRPAINPLFRSAAVTYGPRVAGVILTGAMDDGTAGLWWIKRFGGLTIVQDPEEAEFPDMPRSALANVEVDYVLKLSGMGRFLTELAGGRGVAPTSFQAKSPQERLQWK